MSNDIYKPLLSINDMSGIENNSIISNVNFTLPHRNLIMWRNMANRQLLEALNEIKGLDSLSKKALLYRTSNILDEYTVRAGWYSGFHHVGRAIVTIGSLSVPALLSIQSGASTVVAPYLYWLTWSISLLVTIFNGILTLFKVEKKFYYLNTLEEQVRSEGWQYIHLTGKYGGHHFSPEKSTHINEIVHFTHALERIKLNQTNDEYWKSQEAQIQQPVQHDNIKGLYGLYTPTPSGQHLFDLDGESSVSSNQNESTKNIVLSVDGSKELPVQREMPSPTT